MKLVTKDSNNIAVEAGARGEERIASLFQPDVLLVDQYLANFRRKNSLEPEKALMLAVLEDGVRCFQDNLSAHSEKKKKLFEEALEWLFSDDADWLFSFISICEALGFDPDYLRRGLKHWQERAQSASQKKSPGPMTVPHRLVA
jgi:hypothetical protein